MKKLLALVLTLLLVAACFAGCGEKADASDLEYIKEKGVLIVGVTDFEPMDYQVDGKWTGFDAELAELVGKELGVEVKLLTGAKKKANFPVRPLTASGTVSPGMKNALKI